MGSPQQWVSNRLDSEDDGFTLTEVMAGMVIMTIFMAIFTSSIVNMFSASNKVQATEISSAQLNTAFDRLDKQVRYASVIDCPHLGAIASARLPVAGTCSTIAPSLTSPPFVEFLTPGATPMCTQLTIRTSATEQPELVERTWPQTAATTPTGWSQLALGISLTAQDGHAVTPFGVTAPTGGTLQHQQLQLQLVALDGSGQAQTVSTSSIAFSALNSTAALPTTNPCQPVAAP